MTTLRARLAADFDPASAIDWWTCDDAGRTVDRGRAAPARWPAADRVELALAAEDTPIVALALPPLDAAKRAAAAAYALDDRVAVPVDTLHVRAPAPAVAGAPTLARLVDRAFLARVSATFPRAQRIVAEADLAPADGAWRWCVDASGRGFVRRADGSAFGAGQGTDSVPPELAVALERERRGGTLPPEVVVDAPFAAPPTIVPGVRGRAGSAWSIAAVPAARWASAPDLREGLDARAADASASTRPSWRWAFAFLVAAAAVHVGSLGWELARDRYATWRDERALMETARTAGVDETSPRAAAEALARRATASAHAAGRMADGDFVPMLARAAPSLSALPSGAMRKLTYADRRLVVDLAAIDQARSDRLLADLATAGLKPIAAPVAGGLRVALLPGP